MPGLSSVSTQGSSVDFPELRACSAVRASIVRQLLRERNTLDRALEALSCSLVAREQLMAWLNEVIRELPDPAALTATLFQPDLEPSVFEATWETLESTHGVFGRMPKPAREYLDAIAEEDNAEQLALFYWAHLHQPLRDQLDLLRYAVTDLVLSDRLTRRVQQALKALDDHGQVESPTERTRAARPAGLEWADEKEKRALGNLTRTADPIARLLSDVQVQPVDENSCHGPLAHRRIDERRQATRTYTIDYVRQHLSLPVGRHALSRHGQRGDDFWVDFG